MALSIRFVEPEVLAGKVKANEHMEPVLWAAVYDGWGLAGHGCISRVHGQLWAHDLAYWGKDPTGVAQLVQKFRKELKGQHVTVDVATVEMASVFEAMGFSLKALVFEGSI